MPRLVGVIGAAIASTSDSRHRSFRRESGQTSSTPSPAGTASASTASTRISKPVARRAIARPMLPKPTIPIVSPLIALRTSSPRPHSWSRWSCSNARNPRVCDSSIANVCSAMVAAWAPRILVTTMSVSASAGTRHIHSTPALGDCTQRSCLALARSSAVSCP